MVNPGSIPGCVQRLRRLLTNNFLLTNNTYENGKF